ncbi:MAG: potassium channel family protein [Gaiellaceae bacterium]
MTERHFARRLILLLAALATMIIGSGIAFAAVEKTSVAYGLAWALDKVTTVGALPTPRTVGGRVILAILELFGIGTLFYGLATVAEFFVSGQLSGLLDHRRIQRMIDSYSDHFIVCGYGRVGRQVTHDLRAGNAQVVVVDQNPENRETARHDGVAYIEAQASHDEVLLHAGIEHAAAVIACVDSDAENIFIALTARELSSKVRVIARASIEESERKLLHAGADEVISPYTMAGAEMARLALSPTASS